MRLTRLAQFDLEKDIVSQMDQVIELPHHQHEHDHTLSYLSEVQTTGPVQEYDEICKKMHKILCSEFVLYSKTIAAHVNVTGMSFASLHELFKEQYEGLFDVFDNIAEQIRQLGDFVNGNLTAYQECSVVQDWVEHERHLKAQEYCGRLAYDHHLLSNLLRELVHLAEQADQQAVIDLATENMRFHDKASWMLQAHCE